MDLFRFCSVCFAASAALGAAVLVPRSLALASLSLEEARLLADRRDLDGDSVPTVVHGRDHVTELKPKKKGSSFEVCPVS